MAREDHRGQLQLQVHLKAFVVVLDLQLVLTGVEEVQSSLDVFEADTPITNELFRSKRRDAVGDEKIQPVSGALQPDVYPIWFVGMAGDVFESVLHESHQHKWGNSQLVVVLAIELQR